MLQLLVIEDSPLDYEMLVARLALHGVQASGTRVETAAELHAALDMQAWDLVISDHHLPGFSSSEAFDIVNALPDRPPFIIVSGVMGEDAAVEAMRRGVDDYLIKGRLARLGMAARNALRAWTVMLGVVAFSMSMVGTFLVRSGILTSVHAFAVDPTRGSFILALLAINIGAALTLFGLRAGSVTEGPWSPPMQSTAMTITAPRGKRKTPASKQRPGTGQRRGPHASQWDQASLDLGLMT